VGITDALDQMLDADPVLRERDVNLEVNNGTVSIAGEVRTADEKNRVDRIVRAAPGVKDVVNDLQIRPER
jgi:osmotically-inducible protein OsmY